MRVQILQHVPFEGPGQIEEWAQAADHRVQTTRLDLGDPLPPVDDVDLLVIMGGPMGVYDDYQYRWMIQEKQFIAQAIERKKRVLGVCLGAQLIAQVLGARVYPNTQKEIGWYPIELDAVNARHHPVNVLAPLRSVFHWHGDTFDLPHGATHLARSQACENQAFAYGTQVLGLQFHLEMLPDQIEELISQAASDLVPGPFVMDPREILAQASMHVTPLYAALNQMLDQFSRGV